MAPVCSSTDIKPRSREQLLEKIVQIVVESLHQVAADNHRFVVNDIELGYVFLVVILQNKAVISLSSSSKAMRSPLS